MNKFLIMLLDGGAIGMAYHFGKEKFIIGGPVGREELIVSILRTYLGDTEFTRFAPCKAKVKYLGYIETDQFFELKRQLDQIFTLKRVLTFERLMR